LEKESSEIFAVWCKEHGIRAPKTVYPATFGTEEYPFSGIAAKEEIKHRETILAIPHSAIMTHEKAKNVLLTAKDG
jgi:hypothetical protein